MKVLIDANILLRQADSLATVETRKVSLAAVFKLYGLGHECCIVPQILYEFWVVATRPRKAPIGLEANGLGMDPAAVDIILEFWKKHLSFRRDERSIYDHWRDLVTTYSVTGKKSHDTRLVAAMIRHQITHLLTFNGKDFARFPKITAVSPDEVLSDAIAKPTTSVES